MYLNIGLLLNALLLGTMISFLVVTSPTVFKTLDDEHAKKFLRSIFPRLFNFCFLISTFMFLSFALGEFFFGMIFGAVVAISFLINTYFLTPKINKMRDLMLEAQAGSERRFKNLHLASVLLYLLNIIFIILIFILSYTK
tara:strand:+ start:450 stop:869 length:420 start_codon:yes stop_codon:yes gene_type:complete